MDFQKPVIAVCGKGGVGKTVLCALLARAFIALELKPLLLVDADPAGGLCGAVGDTPENTLAQVRESLVDQARGAGDNEKKQIADSLDYLVQQALLERADYSMLAMGRTRDKGCFCPANTLLRQAINVIAEPFAAVLIDAEAGLEQIARRVTRDVSLVIAVADGSQRSLDTLAQIHGMLDGAPMAAVFNRAGAQDRWPLPAGVSLLGAIPEDAQLRDFDRAARPLWELPESNPARAAAAGMAQRLLQHANPAAR